MGFEQKSHMLLYFLFLPLEDYDVVSQLKDRDEGYSLGNRGTRM